MIYTLQIVKHTTMTYLLHQVLELRKNSLKKYKQGGIDSISQGCVLTPHTHKTRPRFVQRRSVQPNSIPPHLLTLLKLGST